MNAHAPEPGEAIRRLPLRDFVLDLQAGELLAPDGRLAGLHRQALDVVVVGEGSLNQAIAEIRRVLGDEARELVRNVARRGYLLVPSAPAGPAVPSHSPEAPMPAPAGAPAARPAWRRPRAVLAGLLERAVALRRLAEASTRLEQLDREGQATYNAKTIEAFLAGDAGAMLHVTTAWADRHRTPWAQGAHGFALMVNVQARHGVLTEEQLRRRLPGDEPRFAAARRRLAQALAAAAQPEATRRRLASAQHAAPREAGAAD